MLTLFSPNILKTYEHCSKKFYFRYIENISMPINDEIFESGKNIHALASYFLRGENIEKMEKILTSKESEIWNYLKSSKYFEYKFINSEYNLNVKIGEYYFGGRLDALVKNGECYYILDYKTGAIPKNYKYDYQTMIYLLAVKEFFKTDNIKFVYIDLKNNNEVIITLNSELENEYKTKLIETAKKINQIENFGSKNKNCNCEYSMICF